MAILPNQLSAATGVSANNTQFGVPSQVLTRKIGFVATYDPAKTDVVPNVWVRVFSPEDVGSRGGFGFMAHRLASRIFQGAQLETWWCPQAEVAGAKAAGTITTTATSALAGTLAIYIAGIRVAVSIAAADTGALIAIKIAAAINAIKELPVTAAVDGVTLNEVDVTAKTTGTFGNEITLEINLEDTDTPLTTLAITSIVIVDMASGTGIPDINTALNAMGVGDNQNEKHFTCFLHGYGQDSATLNKISTYNGVGNDVSGNFNDVVARPFISRVGDNDPGTGELTTLINIGDGRKNDRTNGILAAPDAAEHPDEIAALAEAKAEQIAASVLAQNYIDVTLDGIHYGVTANRWTDHNANRASAVSAGISTTQVKSGVLTIQNLVSFYHPDNVPQASNGYRDRVTFVKIQNIMYLIKLNFSSPKWQGITIVSDVALVSDPATREKAKDIGMVEDDLLALTDVFMGFGLIFSSAFTKGKIAAGGTVTLRPGGLGFNISYPMIPSGAGGIIDTEVQFDTNVNVAINLVA